MVLLFDGFFRLFCNFGIFQNFVNGISTCAELLQWHPPGYLRGLLFDLLHGHPPRHLRRHLAEGSHRLPVVDPQEQPGTAPLSATKDKRNNDRQGGYLAHHGSHQVLLRGGSWFPLTPACCPLRRSRDRMQTLYLSTVVLSWRRFIRHVQRVIADRLAVNSIGQYLRNERRPRTYRQHLLGRIFVDLRHNLAHLAFVRRQAARAWLQDIEDTNLGLHPERQ